MCLSSWGRNKTGLPGTSSLRIKQVTLLLFFWDSSPREGQRGGEEGDIKVAGRESLCGERTLPQGQRLGLDHSE